MSILERLLPQDGGIVGSISVYLLFFLIFQVLQCEEKFHEVDFKVKNEY
jgi:hypothetical protein